MKKSILITGGSGLLAVNWALSIRDKFEVTLILHTRKISLQNVEVDIASLDSFVANGPAHAQSTSAGIILDNVNVTTSKANTISGS